MATKPKARGTKKKAPSTADKEIQKAQGERFIETARELGVDESGKDFEKVFKKVVRRSNRATSFPDDS
jgi:hypothetical protein